MAGLSFSALSFSALSGAALGAALAGALALTLALYLLRLRRRPVQVPFVELWSRLILDKKATAWRSQLRRLLSFLLSAALITALILAFADPRPLGERKGRHLVVLIDTGASMGSSFASGTRLQRAQHIVEQWIEGLGPRDSMLLVAMSARPRPLETFAHDAETLKTALQQLQVQDVRPNLKEALALAQDALRDQTAPEIIVLSDGQLLELDAAQAPQAGDIALRYHDIREDALGEGAEKASSPSEAAPAADSLKAAQPPGKAAEPQGPRASFGIAAFSARRHPLAEDRFEVLLRTFCQFESAQAEQELEAEISIFAATDSGERGAVLEVRRMQLAGEQTVTFSDLAHAEQGLIAELRAIDAVQDDFTGDNIARAVMPKRQPVRVLVVGPLDTFLEAALLIESSLIVKTSSAESYPPEQEFDITIFNGVAPRRDPRTGAAIYLGAPPPSTNQASDDFYPVERKAALQLFGFDSWKKNAAVFRFIDPYDVQVLRGYALVPAKSPDGVADEVLGKSARSAIFVAGERAEGDFLALGFAPIHSDFVLRPVWPLFVLNMIDALHPRGRGAPLSAFATGATVRLPVDDPHAQSATLRGPVLGAKSPLETQTIPVVGGQAIFFAERAGFYDIETALGSVRVATSIYEGARPENADLEQARSAAQVAMDKRKALGATAVVGLEPKPSYDVWYWLVAFVVVASFLEWWTFHRRWTV